MDKAGINNVLQAHQPRVRAEASGLIGRAGDRSLASLGGSEPDLAPAPRRRSDSA
ncbi:hypothetical protein [Acidiphilium iwatense]|uniref:hypothetical protein n=1 Tax=Acidiphilium iwatense TaxID=768198 RepID=UPI001F2881ED|nr:hypothetical protein [Acidiphilium iwatense]